MGMGGFFWKTIAPFSLMTTYQISLILTRSISLDSTFKIALDLRLCVGSGCRIFTSDPDPDSKKKSLMFLLKKNVLFFLMVHSDNFEGVNNFVTDLDTSKNKI
jgi:hypothetical protein